MAKKKQVTNISEVGEPAKITTTYRSAACSIPNAAAVANTWDAEGYDVKWCFPVVMEEEGKAMQALYLLGKKRYE